MADLRDYLPPLFDLYRRLAKQKTSVEYQQIRAYGANHARMRFKGGQFESFRQWDDLSVLLTAAEKKSGKWAVSVEETSDFSAVSRWDDYVSRRLAGAATGADPRPPFPANNVALEECPSHLHRYDPEVAQRLSPVMFHRVYQTVKSCLEKGLIFDGDAHWMHGAVAWDGQPMSFAWVDANAFYFAPQTRIDETFVLYHPDIPRYRRTVTCTSDRVSDMANLEELCEDLMSVLDTPFFRFNRRNIDRVVWMPGAAAKLLAAFLTAARRADGSFDGLGSQLSSSFTLLDTPDDPNFGRTGLTDSYGHRAKSVVLVDRGQTVERLSPDNGHGALHQAELHCPMLTPADPELEKIPLTPREISSVIAGKILIIEEVALVPVDERHFHVHLPVGGALYRDGRCLGHVAPPSDVMDLHTLMKTAGPVGKPVRAGGLATCAIEAAP